MTSHKILSLLLIFTVAPLPVCSLAEPVAESRQVYFGDTHVHTSYSFDAFLNNNQSADPDTAYRWAKGQPVIHPYNRARVQINTPLDFLVVADHAEMLGVMRAVHNESIVLEDLGWFGNLKRWIGIKLMLRAIDNNTGMEFFGRFLPIPAIGQHHADPVADMSNNIDSVDFLVIPLRHPQLPGRILSIPQIGTTSPVFLPP